MTEIEKAIKHFDGLQKRYTTTHNGKHCELVKTAIAALLEKQARESGCEWCNPNPYGHGEAIRPLISQVFNDKAQISTMISGAGLHTLAVPSPEDTNLAKRYSKCQIIHFCPMCGKRLEEYHDAD